MDNHHSGQRWTFSLPFLEQAFKRCNGQDLERLNFQIRLIICFSTFFLCLISLFFMEFNVVLHSILPLFLVLYLYLLFHNKTSFLLGSFCLISFLLIFILFLQKEDFYLCMLTSSLGMLAIFSIQGFPPQLGLLLGAGLMVLQKHFFSQLNDVFEPITDSYRINASSVRNAMFGWLFSLLLEILGFLIYQFSFRKMCTNFQTTKLDLEKINRNLRDSNTHLKKTIEELTLINQDLTKVLKARDLFIACVSHELKNPLNVLLNGIDQLSTDMQNLTEFQSEILKSCQICGDSLKGQVNNLLDASKLNANKLEISTTVTKMSTFLDNIWSMARIGLERKNLTGNLSVDKSIPKWLDIDSHHLQQVLDNLIGNAIKFTTKGSIRITFYWITDSDGDDKTSFIGQDISTEQSPRSLGDGTPLGGTEEGTKGIFNLHLTPFRNKNMTSLQKFISFKNTSTVGPSLEGTLQNDPVTSNSSLRIDVVDTGCGIAEEEQPKIFEPFEQANVNIRRKYGGTGLGLYIVKGLVDKMGGTIKMSSLKDVGTRFQILIPVKGKSDEIHF